MSKGEVTLKDIAKTVGKSVATVSKALHDHDDIASETREAIKQVAQSLGYRPNITARRLQKKRTETLGLVVPLLSARQADPFFTELLAGVADQAAAQGFDLLVSTRTPGAEEEAAYQRLVSQQRVDGLIIAQPRSQDWRISFLESQHLPFVVVGHLNQELDKPSVLIDTTEGIKQGVDHLISQGRDRLALIPPPSKYLFAPICQAAFEAAIADQANVQGETSVEVETASQKEGYRATQILLAGANPPDGILTYHDLVAMGAMAAIQDQGFEVGNDIAVVGFGDILLSEHAQPPLTSVHQPTYTMGQQACAMLINLIEGKTPSPAKHIITPWLVVRQSSELVLWL